MIGYLQDFEFHSRVCFGFGFMVLVNETYIFFLISIFKCFWSMQIFDFFSDWVCCVREKSDTKKIMNEIVDGVGGMCKYN